MKKGIILISIAAFLCSFTHVGTITKAQSQTTAQSAANSFTVVSGMSALTNSATETTLFTRTIPAGLLGTARGIHGKLICVLSSTIVNPPITIRLKFGAATPLVMVGNLSINASLASSPFVIDFDVRNTATGAQIAFSETSQNTITGPFPTTAAIYHALGSWTVDTTSDQVLSVTAQFTSALTGTTLVPQIFTLKIE